MEAKANNQVVNNTLKSVDPISAKFDEVLSRGTLETRFSRTIASVRESLAANRYPESRRAAVEYRTLEYIAEIAAGDYIARANVDQFTSITSKFNHDLVVLAQPIPIPRFHENLTAHHARLHDIGWTSREIEALTMYADGGAGGTDRIVSYTVNDATFASGKSVTRGQIRDGIRPAWQPKDEWEETREFQKMCDAHAASVANEQMQQAEQVVRISAGPARMIGRIA